MTCYSVFDIESESRPPPKVATNDPTYKKAHIRSLLLAEVRFMFSMPAQITGRSSYRSHEKCFIRMIEQRYVIEFVTNEHCTGLKFINTSKIITGRVRCLAASCTD
jgi:hypothetical protein